MMRGGDGSTREELAWLLAVARRLASSADSEDIAQDAWLAVRDGEPRPQSWWRGVVRNRWRMGVRSDARRRTRERDSSDMFRDSVGVDPEDLVTRRHVAQTLLDCLDALDAVDRRIVTLRHCEGWSATEIAEELQTPAATVRTRLRRALKTLRRGLDERWGDESRRWQLAVAPTAGLGLGPASTAAPILAGWVKWALAAVLLSSVAGIWIVGASSDDAPSEALAGVGPSMPLRETDARAVWSSRLATLSRARSRRLLSTAARVRTPDEVDDAADALRGLFFEDAGSDAKPLLRALGTQVSQTLKECARLHPSEAGALTVRAQLIGEPDIGTIVESVEVTKDTVGDPQLRECVEESAYTYEFPDAVRSLYAAHDFTIDMDAKQVAAGAVLPVDKLPGVLERYPEFLDALPRVLEQVPGIRAPLRSLITADPALAVRLPRFAELIAAGDEAEAL